MARRSNRSPQRSRRLPDSRGETGRRFFAVHDIPVAARHRLQQHARDTYDVALDVFEGQAVAGMLTQGDRVWIAPADSGSDLVDDPGRVGRGTSGLATCPGRSPGFRWGDLRGVLV
jgi:hypothetical protein